MDPLEDSQANLYVEGMRKRMSTLLCNNTEMVEFQKKYLNELDEPLPEVSRSLYSPRPH